MSLETLVYHTERLLELAAHRHIQLGNDGSEIGRGLVHVRHLRLEEVMARLQLLVRGGRLRIVSAEVLQPRTKLVDLPPDARRLVGR